MATFPGAISTDSDLYIAVNQTTTQLSDNPLSNSATTVNVTATAAFPTVGFISIDAEIIKYTGKTATSFTGCTRASDGTTAASHVQNSQVYHNVIAVHHNALKDEIKATQQNISDRFGLSSTQISAPLGTAALPTYSFTGDSNTGIYSSSADTIVISVGGVATTQFDTTQLFTNVPIKAGPGTAGGPSHSFSADPDTGMYNIGPNNIGIATNGVKVLDITTSRLGINTTPIKVLDVRGATDGLLLMAPSDDVTPTADIFQITNAALSNVFQIAKNGTIHTSLGTAALPSFSLLGDTDTGFYGIAANQLGASVGGIKALDITATSTIVTGASSSNLHVLSTDASGVDIRFLASGTSTAYIQTQSNHPIVMTTNNGVDALVISTSQAVGIRGTATNDNATTGFVGQFISSTLGVTNVTTSAAFVDATSISLTAGDWDVSGQIIFQTGTGVVTAGTALAISINSGNTTTDHVRGDNVMEPLIPTATVNSCGTISEYRMSLSATTTVYLKTKATLSVPTTTNYQVLGRISARRRR